MKTMTTMVATEKDPQKEKAKGRVKKGKDFEENYEQSYRDGRQGARGLGSREKRKEIRKGIERKPTEERQDQGPMKYGSNKWCRHQLDTLTEQMAGFPSLSLPSMHLPLCLNALL